MKKPKTIITFLLLIFVAVSLVYAVIKESGLKQEHKAPAATLTKEPTRTETQSISETAEPESKVVAYYFHGNTRCVTCRTIESYAREAIENGFSEALKKGQLEFKVVNVEEPQNEHFVQDYQLSASTVVVARFKKGKQRGWKNLHSLSGNLCEIMTLS
jgi:hypothetical protein